MRTNRFPHLYAKMRNAYRKLGANPVDAYSRPGKPDHVATYIHYGSLLDWQRWKYYEQGGDIDPNTIDREVRPWNWVDPNSN
jgi:hypothetical protein